MLAVTALNSEAATATAMQTRNRTNMLPVALYAKVPMTAENNVFAPREISNCPRVKMKIAPVAANTRTIDSLRIVFRFIEKL